MFQNLICFGDSITDIGRDRQYGWTPRLQRLLDESAPERFVVHNAGVGGNTTLHALDRFMHDVQPLLPGIVLIEFGINDGYICVHSTIPRQSCGEYARNITEIIRLVREGGGEPILIVNHPMTRQGGHQQGNGLTVEENTWPYNEKLRMLASESGVGLIDLPQISVGKKLTGQDLLAEDGVHLSNTGQGHYAQMVYEGLVELKTIHR